MKEVYFPYTGNHVVTQVESYVDLHWGIHCSSWVQSPWSHVCYSATLYWISNWTGEVMKKEVACIFFEIWPPFVCNHKTAQRFSLHSHPSRAFYLYTKKYVSSSTMHKFGRISKVELIFIWHLEHCVQNEVANLIPNIEGPMKRTHNCMYVPG